MTKSLKKIVPWLVVVGIFAYLFHHYPPAKVWQSLQYVRVIPFLFFSFGYFFWIYLVDVFSVSRAFQRFGHKLTLKELFPVRGVTYLLMVLNYAAGQAGFAYYLKRTHRIPLFEVLSFLFFIAVIDLYWIITLGLVGSFMGAHIIGGIDITPIIRTLALVAYIALALNFLFWHDELSKKIGIQPHWAFIRWLRSKKIFRVFKEAGWKDYLGMAALRAPIHFTIILSFYILFEVFQTHISFSSILGNIPIVFLIGIIPVTPGGLGTTNVALVQLLAPHLTGTIFQTTNITPEELLFSVTLVWMFTNYSLKILTGLFCIRKVSRELFAPTEETSVIEKAPILETPPGFTNPT